MNIALWVAAGLLAFAFLAAGGGKLAMPKDKLYASGQKYVEDLTQAQVRLIGTAEVLAAIGLIVPPLVGILPILAPIAAAGLVLLMIGAALTHARRREWATSCPTRSSAWSLRSSRSGVSGSSRSDSGTGSSSKDLRSRAVVPAPLPVCVPLPVDG